jgi:hypothetical protein
MGNILFRRVSVDSVGGDGDMLVIRVVRLQEPQPGNNTPFTDPKVRPELALIPWIIFHHFLRGPQDHDVELGRQVRDSVASSVSVIAPLQ